MNLASSIEQLCMDLLGADTEEQVIHLLEEHGYWNDPAVWRAFGDKQDNFSTIGNQASTAEGALVEKLVNSVDAVLMGECWTAGIPPNSMEAPRSIPEAVAQFFFGDRSKADSQGHLANWPNSRRREVANRITLAATGSRQNPSFTIVDNGEGQSPDTMPDTLLSLDKANKVDVHFVQGKFNMGGTGALRYCGGHNLQLVISRRNPNILSPNTSNQWGFTVVRRENPTPNKKVSTYTYLAPCSNRTLLSFDADEMPLFPSGNDPYARPTAWGTAIKLYEYQVQRKSHILLRDGLNDRLSMLLPAIALPVRVHECRDFRGHPGSFDTTLTGLTVRLSDDKSENIEPNFPTGGSFTIRGQPMNAEVYAFKRGKGTTYRDNEGIVFTVNGQSHGNRSKRFFSRRAVGMGSLEDSIIVIVDCSQIDGRTREDLFMNSRDRLEQGEFLRLIESELADMLRNHPLLRELREQRRREDVATKLKDSKPLQDILQQVIHKYPEVARLLGHKGPLSDPFKSTVVKQHNEFKGAPHPSYFRFRRLEYGEHLSHKTPINTQRSRIPFETDVVNDYFTRAHYPGRYEIKPIGPDANELVVSNVSLNPVNGIATLNFALPEKMKIVGGTCEYELVVNDDTLVEPFTNRFTVTVGPHQKHGGGDGSRNTNANSGEGNNSSMEGLALPTPISVYEADWDKHNFDRNSALKVVLNPTDADGDGSSHDYYLNMDNIHLNTHLKSTREEPDIVRSRWQVSMVLIGMALISEPQEHLEEEDMPTPAEKVSTVTSAVAPVLLPLIEHLGALRAEDVATSDGSC